MLVDILRFYVHLEWWMKKSIWSYVFGLWKNLHTKHCLPVEKFYHLLQINSDKSIFPTLCIFCYHIPTLIKNKPCIFNKDKTRKETKYAYLTKRHPNTPSEPPGASPAHNVPMCNPPPSPCSAAPGPAAHPVWPWAGPEGGGKQLPHRSHRWFPPQHAERRQYGEPAAPRAGTAAQPGL